MLWLFLIIIVTDVEAEKICYTNTYVHIASPTR